MIQETVGRVSNPSRFASPIIICNEDHRFIIAEQMRAVGVAAEPILEPVGRNTAPAVAVAAMRVAARDPEGVMVVLPADHVIRDGDGFLAALDRAAAAAEEERLVTFGIKPTHPETGYGYIRRGPETGIDGVHVVDRFAEKPDPATAAAFVESGEYYWNSGMFVFKASRYLQELERFEPAVVAACREALDKGVRDLDFFRLDRDAFERNPSNSIDYAVMERTDRAAVVPVDIGWTDVGSWAALWEIGDKDADGNVLVGEAKAMDSRGCYIRGEDMLVAVLGVDDIVVTATEDAVLVVDKKRSQDIKALVTLLNADGRAETMNHVQVHRPWGFYRPIHTGERFQVKRLSVNPNGRLSSQRHFHRSEHWVVVNGTARVTLDGKEFLLYEGQSVYIPSGAVHRLDNPGRIPLNIIEVQTGAYLGEDDIVRFEDDYKRN